MKVIKSLAQAYLCAAALLGSDTHAASKEGCIVTQVQIDDGRLGIWCANESSIYYAHTYVVAGTQCPTASWESIKMWASMSQSALLSGRQIYMWFGDLSPKCNIPNINAMGIKR